MSDTAFFYVPRDGSCVLLDLEPANREELFALMVGRLEAYGSVLDAKAAVADVMMRESTKPTGLALGVACPHARTDAVRGVAIAVARLRKPLDFGATDGQPARHVFLVLSPRSDPNPHIDTLAAIVKCYRNKELVARLDAAATPGDYLALLGGSP